ncbi:MAG: hypothetical protein K2J95_11970 [Lachnospiraceae bacterium]|nr:hypothetical protein [Lachnospiraceae bacterium]
MKMGVDLVIIYMMMMFGPWVLLCLGIMGLVLISFGKKEARWVIKILGSVILCIILWAFVNVINYIIVYESMWYGIWLALCLTVTVVTVIVQWINKKLLKKKPIHWAKKLAAYVVFYAITLFVLWKGLKPYLEPYPSNWLATNKVYRELAYELYNLELDCYEYERIHKGSDGEIVISFEEHSYLSDHILRRTLQQRDYIVIKTAVEEYMEVNESFQGNKINLDFRIGGSGGPLCSIYNFDPETGEIGTEVPRWFAEGIYANNCTELAEFYHDFSKISASIETIDDMQELANLRNLTYLHLYVGGAVREDKELEKQYLEELNTLLPDCEIHLNQYNIEIRPAWEEFSD